MKRMMDVGRVGILTGSQSDLGVVRKVCDALDELGVPCELRVLSAHRSPELTVKYVRSAQSRGVEVIIACAGMANHLAGTVAAHTRIPVIGVPLMSGALGGLDSLLSTVQMPPGVPVATVSVDGARNAAFLAARILGVKYEAVRVRLEEAATAERRRYEEANAAEATGGRNRSVGSMPRGSPRAAKVVAKPRRRRAQRKQAR